MKLFNFLHKSKDKKEETASLKTVKDLDVFDSIWIKEDGEIYNGWIFDISRRHITVVYDLAQKDYMFQIPRPLTVDKIEQDNKILYCNNPENDN